ncbi:hypothetical protein FHG87_024627 [Trinorchestia longiramus]|nr:hypothetical protein FHG87_024627 [Trinorchestia longiramus]
MVVWWCGGVVVRWNTHNIITFSIKDIIRPLMENEDLFVTRGASLHMVSVEEDWWKCGSGITEWIIVEIRGTVEEWEKEVEEWAKEVEEWGKEVEEWGKEVEEWGKEVEEFSSDVVGWKRWKKLTGVRRNGMKGWKAVEVVVE